MEVTSSAFEYNGHIPAEYTCDGENITPPLSIRNVPRNAQSLVCIVEDPDVPSSIREDNLWVHWVVFDIEPEDQELQEGETFSSGVESITTYDKPGYGGPCPPDREHRYFFKVWALDAKLDLDEDATRNDILQALEGHIIEYAELVGRYERE